MDCKDTAKHLRQTEEEKCNLVTNALRVVFIFYSVSVMPCFIVCYIENRWIFKYWFNYATCNKTQYKKKQPPQMLLVLWCKAVEVLSDISVLKVLKNRESKSWKKAKYT